MVSASFQMFSTGHAINLGISPAITEGRKRMTDVNVLLDAGAENFLVLTDLVEGLCLTGEKSKVLHSTVIDTTMWNGVVQSEVGRQRVITTDNQGVYLQKHPDLLEPPEGYQFHNYWEPNRYVRIGLDTSDVQIILIKEKLRRENHTRIGHH